MNQIIRYIIGFVSSVVLTLIAYGLVTQSILDGSVLIVSILALAVVQLFVQLIFFLHLSEEKKPRYRLQGFMSMAVVLLVVVLGSIWIMNNLDYNMGHGNPQETDAHMMKERDRGF